MNIYEIDGLQISSEEELTEEQQQEYIKMYKQQQEFIPEPVEGVVQQDFVLKANKYDSLFEEIGNKHDINPQILKAIAEQESSFDPLAEGKDGEIGMMQLMPIIRNEYNVKNPTDPRENIEGAAKFLDHLLKKYDNDLDKTLQAYNGGETLVDKQGGSQQTRDYRDSVMSLITPSIPQISKNPIEGISNPAESAIVQPEQELEIKYDELYENDEYFNHVQDYMLARFGKDGNLKQGETRKEYVSRFANHMRHVEYNNIDLAQELLWTNSANEQDRTRAGFAFTLWDSIPIFDGGYNKFEAFADIGQALVTDLTTYLGLGVGKVTSMVAAKGALNRAKAIVKEQAAMKKLKSRADKKLSKENIDSLKNDLERYNTYAKRYAMGVGAGVEGVVGAYQGGMKEELALQQYRKETFDYSNVAIESAVGGLFGAVSARLDIAENALLGKSFISKELDQSEQIVKDFEAKLKANKNPNIKKQMTTQEKSVSDLLAKSDQELEQYFNYTKEGRKLIDDFSPEQRSIFQTQVKTKLYPIAVKVAGHIMLNDLATYGPKVFRQFSVYKKGGEKPIKNFDDAFEAEKFLKEKGTKDYAIKTRTMNESIGDAVNRVIGELGEIDALTIEAAAKKAGIDPETYSQRVQKDLLNALKENGIELKDFQKAFGSTLSDSARVMQPYSYVSRIYNSMIGVDKDSQEFITNVAKQQFNPGFFSKVGQGLQNLEQESKVWVTSALSTTTANIQGTLSQATFGTAARGFELMFNKIMRGMGTALGADPKVLSAPQATDIGSVFGEWVKMKDFGMTTLEADEILKFNPTIRDALTNTLITGTVDEKKISKFGRFLSTLNLAQDTYFRKSFFTASVERQLRNIGKNLHTDFLAKDLPIPVDILKKAQEDAMRATFTYQFKNVGFRNKDGQFSIERAGNTLAYQFIKAVENFPTGSIFLTPFPRFVANGLNSLYRYSPFGGASGLQDIFTALSKKADDMPLAERQALYNNGVRAFSQGTVGLAMIYGAAQYRSYNQDSEVTKITNSEGDTFDITNVFPIAQYFALGDLFYNLGLMGDRPEGEKKPSMKFIDETIKVITNVEPQRYGGLPFLGPFSQGLKQVISEGGTEEEVKKVLARGIADFLGRFPQPIKPVKEFFEGMSSEGFISRDPKDIPFDVLLDSDTNLLGQHLNNQLKNKLPPHLLGNMYGKEQLREAVQYFRMGPPTTAGGFLTNFLGAKLSPSKNIIEKEIIKLGMQPWQMYSPTGIKTYDNLIISNSIINMERLLVPIIKSSKYQNLDNVDKALVLKDRIQASFTLTKENFKNTGIDLRTGQRVSENLLRIMDYISYRQLPKLERESISRKYEDKYGESLDETKEYERAVTEFRPQIKPEMLFRQSN